MKKATSKKASDSYPIEPGSISQPQLMAAIANEEINVRAIRV